MSDGATDDAPDGVERRQPTSMRVRKHPAHGVLVSDSQPTIVFLTVCTKNRQALLANADMHDVLRTVWLKASAWLVGRYVVLPDHIHLFASPSESATTLENWIRFWKSSMTKESKRVGLRVVPGQFWQTNHWDARLRNWQSYEEKWEYVRNNPVRHGLVSRPEDWPYQGEIHRLTWE